jgi:hypothetical protein
VRSLFFSRRGYLRWYNFGSRVDAVSDGMGDFYLSGCPWVFNVSWTDDLRLVVAGLLLTVGIDIFVLRYRFNTLASATFICSTTPS